VVKFVQIISKDGLLPVVLYEGIALPDLVKLLQAACKQLAHAGVVSKHQPAHLSQHTSKRSCNGHMSADVRNKLESCNLLLPSCYAL
jgi:hypothetical protein